MEHPNVAIARKFLKALDDEDLATIETLVAQDVVGHFPGSNPLSGTYNGRHELFGMFAKGDELTSGTWERDLHDVTAGDDHVVILVRLTAQRDGETFTWNGANVWHVRDGKLTEVWFLSADQQTTDTALR
jgi:ketosteroid isomerase-like protein